MRITEVRIKLMEEGDDRLQAFCSVTLDDAFVVRDLKIIDGSSGPFVAMPSRKLTSHCPDCRSKNHLRAAFCNQCGRKLSADLAPKDSDGRAKLYADIAHPINSECREMIQRSVIEAFRDEVQLSKQPGYVSRYDDYLDIDAGPASLEKSSVAKRGEIHIEQGQLEPHRPHPSHHRQPRIVEPTPQPRPRRDAVKNDRDADDFGAGIL